MSAISRRRFGPVLGALLCLASVPALSAQEAEQVPAPFKAEEIDQLVAPVALYPDGLLAQVLMASTYPIEIVQAERWAKAHPGLEGKTLEDALQKEPWDPSVKSLVAFPQVLTMMSEKLDWTQKLGDAFLAQQADVMDGVQRLRAKARAEGHLDTTKEQTVVVEQVPTTQTTVIKIEPANPQVVYVPTYNPTVVYGAWPYPAYPPYYYYPPGYVATASLVSFGVGLAVGSAMWGHADWGHHDVDVNVNRYNEFNNTNIQNKNWQHNAEHRKGVGYRDSATQNRYARQTPGSAQTREQFRGRAEQGRQDLARGGAGDQVGSREGAGGRGTGRTGGTGDRAGMAGGADRGRQSGAFQGVGSGAETRRDSSRGNASRQSASSWGSRGGSGGGGGGGRSGGGMSRGGGGRGGGGGRR